MTAPRGRTAAFTSSSDPDTMLYLLHKQRVGVQQTQQHDNREPQ